MSHRDLPRSPLAAFLRAHGAGILSEWELVVRRRAPDAMAPGRGPLRDELPAVLDRIAERLEAAHGLARDGDGERRSPTRDEGEPGGETGDRASWSQFDSLDMEEPLLGAQALERLRDGFDLEDIAAEYALLRRCVLRLLAETGTQPSWLEMTILHEALDQAIIHPAARSAAARERALAAIDQVTAEGSSAGQLDRHLRSLIGVLAESVRPVEWAAILLLEGEALRVRAALGPDEAAWRGRAYKPAEGFIGRVVRERRPVALRSAALDPLAHDAGGAAKVEPGARGRWASPELHALYGAPLLSDGRLIGVAVASSRRVTEFSEGDRLLFRKVADRAASIVTQIQLREQLASERSRFDAAVQRLPTGVAVAEAPAGAIAFCNRRFSEILRGPDEIPSSAPYHRALLEARDDDEPARQPLARALLRGESVTAEVIEFVRGDGEIRVGSFSAAPVRDAEGRIVAAAVTVDDVTDRTRCDQALDVLYSATSALVRSLGDEGALDELVRIGGEGFADLCMVDLLVDEASALTPPAERGERSARRLLVSARDPLRRALIPRFVAHPFDLFGDNPIAEAFTRLEPTLVPRILDPWLKRVASGPEHLTLLRELGARSAILVPLAARGRPFGLMSLWATRRELNLNDAAAAAQFARLLSLSVEAARPRRESRPPASERLAAARSAPPRPS